MNDSSASPPLRPPLLQAEETLDAIGYNDLQIIQPLRGFRFTIDPIILAGFAQLKGGERWLDLGTGSGILPLLLARRDKSLHITGVEIDRPSADRAKRSVLLNNLEDQIEIVHEDLRKLRSVFPPQSFNAVITNPPYRSPGSGRISSGTDRSIARHELHGCLDDFLDASRYLLMNGGRFYAIYLAERLPELLSKMIARKIEPKRLRCIHSRRTDAANLVLVEGRRSGRSGLAIETPLYIYEGDGYSEEVQRLAGDHSNVKI